MLRKLQQHPLLAGEHRGQVRGLRRRLLPLTLRHEGPLLGALLDLALQAENRVALTQLRVVAALLAGEERVAVGLARGVEHRLCGGLP